MCSRFTVRRRDIVYILVKRRRYGVHRTENEYQPCLLKIVLNSSSCSSSTPNLYPTFLFLPQLRPKEPGNTLILRTPSLLPRIYLSQLSTPLGLHSPTAIMITLSFNCVEITIAIFRGSGLVMPTGTYH